MDASDQAITPDEQNSPDPIIDDEGPIGRVIIDPFTGEHIFTPKRTKLIEEDLERIKQKREALRATQADE